MTSIYYFTMAPSFVLQMQVYPAIVSVQTTAKKNIRNAN